MENKNSNSIQWIAIAIIVASIVISGTIIYTNKQDNLGNNNDQVIPLGQQPSNTVVDASKVETQGVPFVGKINAPLVVAEWYDYQCPFCKRFHDDAIAQIIQNYVPTGKVKVLLKDYAFLGPDSTTAALAGRAVWEVAPTKYYEWHKAMYVKQDAENGGWGNKADILALAQSVGIDSAKVGQLMTSKADEYQKAIDADKAEGISFGINGTPGTIVGNQMISGAQPYATVKTAIDAQLNQ